LLSLSLEAHQIGIPIIEADDPVAPALAGPQQILAAPTPEQVAALATLEQVVALPTSQPVGLLPADQLVIALEAEDVITAPGSLEQVVCRGAFDPVEAGLIRPWGGRATASLDPASRRRICRSGAALPLELC
jgi:hypothetical protein